MRSRVSCSALRVCSLLRGARVRRTLPFVREPLHLYQARSHACQGLMCSALRVYLLLGGVRVRRTLPFGREPLHLYQARPHACKGVGV